MQAPEMPEKSPSPTVLQSIFGRWQPPHWMAQTMARVLHEGQVWMPRIQTWLSQARQWLMAHRRIAIGIVAALAIAAAMGLFIKKWWFGLTPDTAAPIAVSVSVQGPGRTTLEAETEEGRQPKPVHVSFSQDVAPLTEIGKVITQISMDPPAAGQWQWSSANTLTFTPKDDWAIARRYKIKLESDLTPKHIVLNERKHEFSTAAFDGAINSSEFYQDPTQPNVRRVLFQLRFTHPINPAELEKKISLIFNDDCKGGFLGLVKCDNEKFSITYDKHKLVADIQSAPLRIPEKTQSMVLRIPAGLTAAKGAGNGLAQELVRAVEIPSLYSLKISSVQPSIVTGENGEPEHVLHITTSMPVHEREMAKHVQAWLLPEKDDNPDQKSKDPKNWTTNPSAITPAVLAKSRVVKLEPIASEREVVETHGFRMPKAQGGAYLLVRVAQGMKTPGGHQNEKPRQDVVLLNTFAPELSILSKGSLLALSGEKKLPILVRDLPGVQYEIGRLLPQQLQHLVTQTQGDFSNPEFYGNLSADNLTERFSKSIPLKLRPGKSHYETVDFGPYLRADEKDRRGIFLLTVKGYDPAVQLALKNNQSKPIEPQETDQNEDNNPNSDLTEDQVQEREQVMRDALGKVEKRLILVTDLGLVVKKPLDGTREVYVQSIATGRPVDAATVEVWARNGTVIASQNTDATGRAKLGQLSGFTREKVPVVLVVRKGGDMSFMPLNRSDRQLDMSRFDVGGVRSVGGLNQMTGFLFNDRGIYRPGDTFNVGILVKARNWGTSLKDLPVEVEVIDARGLRIKREKIRLSSGGTAEISHTTQDSSPTGNYVVNLYLPRESNGSANEASGLLLGSTTVTVQEFLPDRTKISVKLNTPSTTGWIKPSEVQALVNVQNLFGTPAQNRRVEATLTLTPAFPSFAGFDDYGFYDPARGKDRQTEDMEPADTNEKGEVTFDLNLGRFVNATYQLHFLAKAFEPEGGRSVAGETFAMVSDLPYIVGIKLDGDTSYISKNAVRIASFIALNPSVQKTTVNGLKLERFENKVLSVLVKQSNGLYRYESRRKEVLLETKPHTIAAAGSNLALNTTAPGNFSYVLKNVDGLELGRIDYSVAGNANVTRSLDRNAELQMTLSKKDYNPGEEIEVSIRAPYVGAGLITIELDKVYAHAWFKTDKTASVQKITLPKDFEGTGYVNVHFVRDLSSREIYMSPLSYGTVPFATSLAKRTANIQLTSSELVKPGQTMKMTLTSDKPTRAVVFAVDEGILQVARYKTPDPLPQFFQKRALEVGTTQTLDLILPEFKKLMLGKAPGGDAAGEAGKHLNPFKRKRDKPVAFWSGWVDVNGSREFSYTVPDYFNGSLRVMAVTVNDEAIGSKSRKTLVRGDMVILPNLPTSLAPGDTVEVGVGLANNILNSGKDVPISLKLETTAGLEIVGGASQTLKIHERGEASTRYQIRAKTGAQAQLGSASVIFVAQYKNHSARLSTDISVRPASPYVNFVQAGTMLGAGELQSQADLFPNFRRSDVAISAAPWAFSVGLVRYLEAYPHGCTEQITSQTLPSVLLANRPEIYGLVAKEKADKAGGKPEAGLERDARHAAEQTLQRYVTQLRVRQTGNGGIALWPGSEADFFATTYAMELLIEARDRKLTVPVDLMQKANVYLQEKLNGSTINDHYEWRLRAHAVYVLTKQGLVSAAAMTNLREAWRTNAQQKNNKLWSHDLGAVYLAASYQIVKQDAVAAEILQPVWAELLDRTQKKLKRDVWGRYYDPIVHDGKLLYVVAKHFPQRLKTMPPAAWSRLAEQLKEGWYNSLSSASMLMAIDAYFQAVSDNVAGKVNAQAVDLDGKKAELVLGAINPLTRAQVPDQTAKLKLSNAGDFPLFYSWSEQGYERRPPDKALAQGMEIIHDVLDAKGNVVKQAKLGDELQIRVRVRSTDKYSVEDVALVDMLPGGLEPVLQTVGEDGDNGTPVWLRKIGGSGSWRVQYADIREDRVVFYGNIGRDVQEITYKVRATNVGEYITPPAYGEAMYDRRIMARSLGSKFTVVGR